MYKILKKKTGTAKKYIDFATQGSVPSISPILSCKVLSLSITWNIHVELLFSFQKKLDTCRQINFSK